MTTYSICHICVEYREDVHRRPELLDEEPLCNYCARVFGIETRDHASWKETAPDRPSEMFSSIDTALSLAGDR